VFRLCDRITVLRDGSFVGTYDRGTTAPADIVRAMVGRELPERPERGAAALGAPVLTVSGLTRRPCFRDVSLEVKAGETVALFGLVGSGRSELLETIFGLYTPDAGEISVAGRPVRIRSPRAAARAGIALVPEERQRQGLFFNLSIRHNLVLPERTARGDIIVRPAAERKKAAELISQLHIKAAGVEVPPDSLSGGNQQKIMVARWLATSPRVLLLDEPTKGVDVGAKFEIHEIIRRQAAAGLACLVVSSDLPEVLALADRIIVMRAGHVQGDLPGAGATEEAVMHLATAEAA
ncbi:MAG TPA: sugar ABC transporter ATP-binding protein, partial [Vicinamibacterales bacterium]